MTMENFREELRYEYNLTPESVVLDCGGFKGDFAAGIHARYGCTVHVLEPIKEFFERTARRFDDNPRVKVYNWGIGADSGMARFSVKGDMTGRYADNPETEDVQIKGVQEVFDYLKIDTASLLKLNIEGSEFDVINALMDADLMKRVDVLQVQWHDVAPNAAMRYETLQRCLAHTHSLTFDHGWVWQSWARNA